MSYVFANGVTHEAQFIDPAHLQEMEKAQFPDLPLDFGLQVGCAWMLNGLPLPDGEQPIWHDGGAIPFQAHIALFARKKTRRGYPGQ